MNGSSPAAGALFVKVMANWGHRHDRDRMTLHIGQEELALLKQLNLSPKIVPLDVVKFHEWVAVYGDPDKPDVRVTVRSNTRPSKRRTFKTATGRHKLVVVELKHNKENPSMARKKKAADEDELDELEGLEELDELEDEDFEEPEDEEEDEDEEPVKKRSKKKASKTATKKTRKKKAPVEDDDEDEDEDEDDEDEEEEKPARKRKKKAAATKPSKKSKGKRQAPPTRELPTGKLGAPEIAEMAGVEARDVRVFLRKHKDAYPKNEELGRYAFTQKQATSIAKKVKAASA